MEKIGFSTIFDIRTSQAKIVVPSVHPLDEISFNKMLEENVGKGTIIDIHGYANSFDDAFENYAYGIYKTRIERLQLFPVLFSWPSSGSRLKYPQDTSAAENSEYALSYLLGCITNTKHKREVDVLAHSHGAKLLVRSLTTNQGGNTAQPPRLKTMVLVEPDVDQEFLSQRMNELALASEHIAIYHSANDRALAISEFVFGGLRSGRDGIPNTTTKEALPEQFEVIDASLVAKGATKHSPHLDSPEVSNDIHHLLKGDKPSERFYIRPKDRAGRQWKIVPSNF